MGRHRKGEELLQPRRRVQPVKLDTVGHVLTEMQRIYREARVGNVSTDDMGRMVFALEKIRLAVEQATPVIENGGDIVVVNVVSIPSGAQYDRASGSIMYLDGSTAASPPFVGFIASPDVVELEPQARIAQLEERCAELEKRNSYVEWLLDSKRSAPTPLQVSGPRLIVDNVDVEVEPESELKPEPPPAA